MFGCLEKKWDKLKGFKYDKLHNPCLSIFFFFNNFGFMRKCAKYNLHLSRFGDHQIITWLLCSKEIKEAAWIRAIFWWNTMMLVIDFLANGCHCITGEILSNAKPNCFFRWRAFSKNWFKAFKASYWRGWKDLHL